MRVLGNGDAIAKAENYRLITRNVKSQIIVGSAIYTRRSRVIATHASS